LEYLKSNDNSDRKYVLPID